MFSMWFQILLCEPQSIWPKLLVLSWLYPIFFPSLFVDISIFGIIRIIIYCVRIFFFLFHFNTCQILKTFSWAWNAMNYDDFWLLKKCFKGVKSRQNCLLYNSEQKVFTWLPHCAHQHRINVPNHNGPLIPHSHAQWQNFAVWGSEKLLNWSH